MSTYRRLSKVYKNSTVIPYDNYSKFVIMSDCHRGSGNLADNFLKNQYILTTALKEYYEKNFTYIELGDGDELWENRCIEDIIDVHSNVFELLSKFHDSKRMYMIYGNHDMQKNNKKFLDCHYNGYYCKIRKREISLFDCIKGYEGLILENKYNDKNRIFLVHGHQGDLINDRLWKLGRFLVRYIWKPLEIWGFNDPTKSAKNHKRRNKIEEKLSEWAKKNKAMLISGHTHRPSFSNLNEYMYFNTGTCIHPGAITAIEIEDGCISLIKWSIRTREDKTMYIGKEILEGPVKIEDYFK